MDGPLADFLRYFSDPVLRGPMVGSAFMALATSVIGVFTYLKRESLAGELLSHAAYPGAILGTLLASLAFADEPSSSEELRLSLCMVVVATLSGIGSLSCVRLLCSRLQMSADSALCFILATFFGIGITLTSALQFIDPTVYRYVEGYLYGQAAVMTDLHIWLYALLSLLLIGIIALLFKEFKLFLCDRYYAQIIGLPVAALDRLFHLLLAVAVVISIQAVGVVLVSALLIAPVVAARQFCDSLRALLIGAALVGVMSALLGVYLSTEVSLLLLMTGSGALPTGPTIVFIAIAIAIASLLFAPRRGFVFRTVRLLFFRYRCCYENVLKTIWKATHEHKAPWIEQKAILHYYPSHPYLTRWILWRFLRRRWICLSEDGQRLMQLTATGEEQAAYIVRVHRLWEVYLTEWVGIDPNRVHVSAEEMEHILTPDLEQRLTQLLDNPARDPHHRPIPIVRSRES